MRAREIMAEAKPRKPSGPLTPEQSRRRAEKQQTATAKLSDTKAKASMDVAAAQRKLAAIK